MTRTCASSRVTSALHLFFARIHAAMGSAVQQTNCHPFRHGRWLFMHNGFIDGFAAIKRDLVLAVDESLFPEIKGQADTEVLFYLALTFGLADDPPDAVARAIGFVEACGRQRGITDPFQGTIATSDGESLWVFRYSSAGRSRSLFFSRDARAVKRQYPERPALQQLSGRRPVRGLRAHRRSARRLGRTARGKLRSGQPGSKSTSSCPSPPNPHRKPGYG